VKTGEKEGNAGATIQPQSSDTNPMRAMSMLIGISIPSRSLQFINSSRMIIRAAELMANIIIDIGAAFIKCGYAGEAVPRVIVPSNVSVSNLTRPSSSPI
jgi:hypothetical protein